MFHVLLSKINQNREVELSEINFILLFLDSFVIHSYNNNTRRLMNSYIHIFENYCYELDEQTMCRKGAIIIDRLCGIQLYWCVFILISFVKFMFLDVHYSKLYFLHYILSSL